MEIKYPIIIVISIILFIIVFFVSFTKLKSRKNKRKVANASIIKNSYEYKKILNKYRFGMYILYAIIFVCLLSNSVLSSRIIQTQTKENQVYNRDIILCMDISTSVNDLNAELIETYKDVVKKLNGERFGISIFNTSSYLLVPLTEDYDYVLGILNTLSKALKAYDNYETAIIDDDYSYLIKYLMYGTLVGNEERGSSLIGDGLASCVFNFPNLEEERSRVIVFSTDNDVQGEEYVNVEEAAKISKSKGIKVYSIAPKETKAKFGDSLEKAAKMTSGKYFVQGESTTENIVSSIESTEKSLLEGSKKTVVTDYPEVPYVLLLLGFTALIIVDKAVLS